MSASIRVFLVDDNAPFRESLVWLLETDGFEVHAYDGGRAFLDAWPPLSRSTRPTCLVSDIRMPQMSGLELFEELKRQGMAPPTVFITAHGDVPLAVEAMRKGACDFLEKPFDDAALGAAVRAAIARPVQAAVNGADYRLLERLTPRERQVLELVVASKPNKIIADVLGISIKTVELHRANMMSKLGVKTLPDLMKLALGYREART